MRREATWIAAGAIALGMGLATAAEREDRVVTDRADRPMTDRVMDRVTDRDEQLTDRQLNNIRGTISTATEAALTEGQLRSLAQRLTNADEARLARDFDRDQDQLDALIRQYREAFEAKYGERFSIDDREAVYPPALVQIHLGLTEQAILARGVQAGEQQQLREVEERRIEAEPARDMQQGREQRIEGEAQVGEGRVEGEARVERDARQRDGERVTIEERDVRTMPAQDNLATIVLPEEHGHPSLHIPLVNEGTVFDAWRIDIPLNVEAMTIRNNLQQHLQHALQNQEQWPADINSAYRMTTHLVMMSLFDHKAGEARPAAEAMEG